MIYTQKSIKSRDVSDNYFEEKRFFFPKNAFEHIKIVFWNSITEAPVRNILSLVVLLITFIWGIAKGDWQYFIFFAVLTLVVKLWLVIRFYQTYRLNKKGNLSLIVDFDGINFIREDGVINAEEDDYGTFTTVFQYPWNELKHIRTGKNHILLAKDDGGLDTPICSDDVEEDVDNLITAWKMNLDGTPRPQPQVYNETEINAISDFIEQSFGKYENVYHEIVSPDIHLDVAIIPPSEDFPYYTLCTMGMGAHKMNVPEEFRLQVFDRCELLIYLPADWVMAEKDNSVWENEQHYWPVRLLKDFARIPVTSDSWVGLGHSFSTPDEEPFADNTSFSGAMLYYPYAKHENVCNLATGKSVVFYQVIPITTDELKFKMESEEGGDALIEKIYPICEEEEDEDLDNELGFIEKLIERISTNQRENL